MVFSVVKVYWGQVWEFKWGVGFRLGGVIRLFEKNFVAC